jgi:hypothetical protein
VIQNAKLPPPIIVKDEQSPMGTEIALTTKGGSQPNKVDQEPCNSQDKKDDKALDASSQMNTT